jgi:hypothetical protein
VLVLTPQNSAELEIEEVKLSLSDVSYRQEKRRELGEISDSESAVLALELKNIG